MIQLETGALLGDGRYQVLEVLGIGGFGVTYRAIDHQNSQRVVAVKEFCPSIDGDRCTRAADGSIQAPAGKDAVLDQLRGDVLREAETLADLDVNGVVQVRGYFEANHTAYLVMDLVEGTPLRQSLGSPWDKIAARKFVTQLCTIVAEIHRNGVVHRDLTPNNILLDAAGNPIVVDFGLARGQSASHSRLAGTYGYAAPEQMGMAPGGITPATDVYAVAAITAEVFTGKRPDEAPPIQALPTLAPAIAAAIGRAMELDPSRRTQTIPAFLTDLRGESRTGTASAPAAGAYTPPSATPPPTSPPPHAPGPAGATGGYFSPDGMTAMGARAPLPPPPAPPAPAPGPAWPAAPPVAQTKKRSGCLTLALIGVAIFILLAIFGALADDGNKDEQGGGVVDDTTTVQTSIVTDENGSTSIVTNGGGATLPPQPTDLLESVILLEGNTCDGSYRQHFRGQELGYDFPSCSRLDWDDGTEMTMRIPLANSYASVTMTMGTCDESEVDSFPVTVRVPGKDDQAVETGPRTPILDKVFDVSGAEVLEIAATVPAGSCFVLHDVKGTAN